MLLIIGYFFVGGVVLFTRSLVPYKRKGIRVNVLCPEVRFWMFLEQAMPSSYKALSIFEL